MSKIKSSITLNKDGVVNLGCPCSGEKRSCHKIVVGERPCMGCPASSYVYIAIAIKTEVVRNELVLINLKDNLKIPFEI